MESIPSHCTTCRTALVAGETRCRQCGAVYGEDNLCPRCHNVTPVRADGAIYRCLACNAPRERKPGTTVAESDSLPIAPVIEAASGPFVLRSLGVIAAGGGLLTAALAFLLLSGAAAGVVGLGTAAAGLGVGALLFRAARRRASSSSSLQRAERERSLLELAKTKGGVLTVTDAQQATGLTATQAEALLDSLADGSRVTVELTSDGRVEYHFRELLALADPSAAPHVRVAVDEAEQVEVPADQADQAKHRQEP